MATSLFKSFTCTCTCTVCTVKYHIHIITYVLYKSSDSFGLIICNLFRSIKVAHLLISLINQYSVRDMILSIFCASHITSEMDFQHVIRMFESIRNQTYRTKLWISVSHAPNQDYNVTGNWLQEHVPAGTHLIRAKSKKSQFEHFNLLMSAYIAKHDVTGSGGDMSNQWISFIDDDDTIGMGRMQQFSHLIRTSTILFDSMFLREAVEIQRPDSDDPEVAATPEYWDFCVTARLLRWWLHRAGPLVRQSQFADMFFNFFLVPREGKLVKLNYKDSQPPYHYQHTQNRSDDLLKTDTNDERVWKAMVIDMYTSPSKFTDQACAEQILQDCSHETLFTEQYVYETIARLRHERSAELDAMRNAPHLSEYLRDHSQNCLVEK